MPYMTVTHYTELLPTKDVVLVRGDIINPQSLSQFEVRGMQAANGGP